VIITLYSYDKIGQIFPAILGVLFFVNGLVHIAASLFTASYSPGTISGAVIYIPIGVLIFKKIFPPLTGQERTIAAAAGIIIHIVISAIAFNI
jgi:hypothetical protein